MTDPLDTRLDKWADDFGRHPWRTALRGLAATGALVLVVVVAVSLLSTGSVFFGAFTAKVTNPARVQSRVFQPDNTLTQVAFFHNTCNDVRAEYVQWRNNQDAYNADLAASRSVADPIRQQQAIQALTQDAQNVTAVANQMANAAEDYNSRSRQYTANAFKDAGLPDQINVPPTSQLATWQPPTC